MVNNNMRTSGPVVVVLSIYFLLFCLKKKKKAKKGTLRRTLARRTDEIELLEGLSYSLQNTGTAF